MKKSSTLKFIMNISFLPSICIHGSIILIFIEKSMLVDFFPMEKFFSAIFDFHFRENPRVCNEFQALTTRQNCLGLILCYDLTVPVALRSTLRSQDHGIEPWFPWLSDTSDLKLVLPWLLCHYRVSARTVGPVSVYCDHMRKQHWSATSISVSHCPNER